MDETAGTGRPIVVGVDGSAASLDALRWAAHQARIAGAPLRAVTAWTFPEHPTPFGLVPDIPPPSDELDVVRARLEEVTTPAAAAEGVTEVEMDVVTGDATSVLVEEAADAQLLVIGSRGLGSFAGALLGSVSEHCVRHAPCPVVVVRHQAPAGAR